MTRPLPMPPYTPRRTEPLGVVTLRGWIVKLTGISAGNDLPGRKETDAALAAVDRELPRRPRVAAQPAVAFVIVHVGADAFWVIGCWWDLDILHHRLFRAELGSTDLRRVEPDGPIACVWELLAIDHERQAWVTSILMRPERPDIDGYVASTLTIAGPGVATATSLPIKEESPWRQ
jgi:hypothetical protein